MKAIALIPARYSSSRLLAKPLALIAGVPMIERVYRNMTQGNFDVAVVTDHDEIEQCIKKIGGKVLRVDDEVQTGSERIGLAYNKFLKIHNYDFIINVQGDEPLLQAHAIDNLIQFHAQSNFDITTLYFPRVGSKDLHNSNSVKIALEKKHGKCLYFSRSAIPFYRQIKDSENWAWNQHVGVYCFKPQVLEQFIKLPASPLELAETLEQLRALEEGFSIGATSIDHLPQSVDTQDDLSKVEKLLATRKI